VEAIQHLRDTHDVDGTGDRPKNLINVDRYDILLGTMRGFSRPSFNPCNLLSVRFSDECGIDNGGLTRECLRLSMKSMMESHIFYGPENGKMLSLDGIGTLFAI